MVIDLITVKERSFVSPVDKRKGLVDDMMILMISYVVLMLLCSIRLMDIIIKCGKLKHSHNTIQHYLGILFCRQDVVHNLFYKYRRPYFQFCSHRSAGILHYQTDTHRYLLKDKGIGTTILGDFEKKEKRRSFQIYNRKRNWRFVYD